MILCLRFQLGETHEAALPELVALAENISPVVQALPPDALLVDVRGAVRYFGLDAAGLGSVLRVRALAHFGIGCSIGVAANPMLARMAARAAAPGTTLVVGDAAEFLAGRPVIALDGVGPSTARTLCSYGLDTIGKAAAAPLAALQRILGARAGRELHERAQGIDRTPVTPDAVSRSLAAERRFDRDELDRDRQRRALLSLAEELGVRLRGEDQVCRSLTLTVRYADRTTTTRTRTLREPTAHSAALIEAAYRIHESLGLQRARVRALALRAEDLIPAERAAHQLTFDEADERARTIEAVADRARAKFGPGAVKPGTLAA
ncbi:DNA polymerase Y family protein [Streptomyces sannanensis]